MAAKITTISREGFVWTQPECNRLWFFPNGSEYLRYSPHFHMISDSGFRMNLPLLHMFVVVHEGKLSMKDYWGDTYEKIEVRDQVWFVKGTQRLARASYARMIPGKEAYGRRLAMESASVLRA